MFAPQVWSLSINKTSSSHYSCRSLRNSGHVVEYDGWEDPEKEIAIMMLAVEMQLSGLSLGIISVIITFNRHSKWHYDNDCFNSWWIELGENKITYDGKEGWLTHKIRNVDAKIMVVNIEIKPSYLMYCIGAISGRY